MLRVVGDEQPDDEYLARLARQQTYEFACVVDSTCRNLCRSVRSGIAANCRLGHCPWLDGSGVHAECPTLQSHARRYTGPYYLAMIVPVMALGAGLVTVGTLGWVWLGLIILGGSGLIWWATERAWGKFS